MRSLIKNILPYSILMFIRKLRHGNYYYFLWLFPLKKNKIVICNYTGKGYGDNGKSLSEEILSQGSNYDIVWLLKKELINKSKFPPQIRIVQYGSLRGLYELATAKIWIDNCRKTFYPPKRSEQFYIQTWHGGIALKKVEKDAESKLDSAYVEYAKRDSEMADIFISNSKFCTDMYRSAFWYENKIIECGSPRCDSLINKSNTVKEKVKNHFKISNDVRILLYAPTFRANGSTAAYGIDFNKLCKVLEGKFGGKWCILIRLHPNVSSKGNFMDYSSHIINATNYDDMYELLASSDILITDYSSTMFEFSFTKKPVFLYTSDIDAYIKDRNFYFDLKSLPYPVAENNLELFTVLREFNESEYLVKLNKFLIGLGVYEEGNASTKIVEVIDKVLISNKA
ncbi:CDP-glycerol glycerophosphotransferase family protein [Cytobacillus firmus]|uniref:CDP-glycerol glycerophosphotransferase family protein n=1 Tax=Cytobacillus firmus TaxID=1399 RepID=UPI0018CDBF38|nr:CDP-glycerol glycerophosphotransferase family protein [Cytobacillus firmus]MBG9444260.1 hypothetical protein [Cytobacillus firmus]